MTPQQKKKRKGQRKLNNEELHDLYCTPNTIFLIKSWMTWVRHAAYKISVRKPEGKTPHGRCGPRTE